MDVDKALKLDGGETKVDNKIWSAGGKPLYKVVVFDQSILEYPRLTTFTGVFCK